MPSSVVATSTGSIYLVDDETGATEFLRDYNRTFLDVAVTRGGEVFAIDGSSIYRLNLATGGIREAFRLDDFSDPSSFPNALFVADGLAYTSSAVYGDLTVTRISSGAFVDAIDTGTRASAGDIVVAGDRAYLLNADRTLSIVNLATERTIRTIDHGIADAYGLTLHADGLQVFTPGRSYLIDLDTGDVTFQRRVDVAGDVFGASDAPLIRTGGTAASETIRGSIWDDAITAGAGRDVVRGRTGGDSVAGGTGADSLYGGSGGDTLLGGDGADLLRGDAGRDALRGGDGADDLDGGTGRDLLAGGAGRDAFTFRVGSDRILDFADDVDTLRLDDALWDGRSLSVSQILGFATDTGRDVLFDFGAETLRLEGLSGINALRDDLQVV